VAKKKKAKKGKPRSARVGMAKAMDMSAADAIAPRSFLSGKDVRTLVLDQYDTEFKNAVSTFIDRSGSPPIIIAGKPVTAEESFRNFLGLLSTTQPQVMRILDELFPK